MVRAGVAVLVCAAFLSTGCLQQTHKIPRGELMRLSMTPPEQRGQSVRVIQDLAGEQPPAATRVESGAHVDVIIIPDSTSAAAAARRRARPTASGPAAAARTPAAAAMASAAWPA